MEGIVFKGRIIPVWGGHIQPIPSPFSVAVWRMCREQSSATILPPSAFYMRTDGIIFKGKFCPFWGGLYAGSSDNPSFMRGGLADVSRALKAELYDAAVVVLYED